MDGGKGTWMELRGMEVRGMDGGKGTWMEVRGHGWR